MSAVVAEGDRRAHYVSEYESDEYQAVINLRRDNTEGVAALCDGFVAPS